ncbi:Uma2 family endonuclease [Stieleria sp. ICT_E10.1]|uniref:Uma2 family endonuclease n=1 Tax=Stieleria sedimenti TaxID=2976331 RepID=UPI00217FEEB1|nr:Uma2 family endonuclease [Stieleria sedimenti]MCS7466925.1 Uma2 family endonuclease [Stieleria sedimenti]
MPTAGRYLPHYTVEDLQRWEGDWELWQGIAVSMTPSPFGSHQRVARNLVVELDVKIRELGCQANVLYEIDWIVSRDTVVRPDVIVVCGAAPEKHVESPPPLIAEIQSASTVERDREAKRDLYQDQGVGIYLLIDPDQETFEAYRKTGEQDWKHEMITDTIEFSICGDCHLRLSKASLFR